MQMQETFKIKTIYKMRDEIYQSTNKHNEILTEF